MKPARVRMLAAMTAARGATETVGSPTAAFDPSRAQRRAPNDIGSRRSTPCDARGPAPKADIFGLNSAPFYEVRKKCQIFYILL